MSIPMDFGRFVNSDFVFAFQDQNFMLASVCSYLSSIQISRAEDRKAVKERVDNITSQETFQRTVMLTLLGLDASTVLFCQQEFLCRSRLALDHSPSPCTGFQNQEHIDINYSRQFDKSLHKRWMKVEARWKPNQTKCCYLTAIEFCWFGLRKAVCVLAGIFQTAHTR